MLLILLSLVAITFLVFYLLMTWKYNYWKKRGIPYMEPRFPFGNVADAIFTRRIIADVYQEIYDEFQGSPVCGFFKLQQPILMVRDPDIIKTILTKEFNNFHDNDFHCNPKSDPIMAINPFVVTGERWKEVRGAIAPAQSPAKLRTMIPCSVKAAKKMIEYLDENLLKSLEMTQLMGHYTTDITASWGLGLEVNSFKNPDSDFRKVSYNMFGGDFSTNLAILLGIYAPALGDLLRLRMVRKDFVNYFVGVVKEVLDTRLASGVVAQDMIQVLLDSNSESKTRTRGRVMDYEEIAGHALTFFAEGYLTTSITLSYILFYLARDAEVQEKAREQVRSVVDSIDELDYEKSLKLTYLLQIMDEALRLHAVLPQTTRLCTKKTTLSLGGNKTLEVEEGTSVAIPVQAIHHDAKYFPEPYKFDPDRFTEEAKKTRNSILYLGFGEGPRACVGMKIAHLNIKVCLAALLLNYKILPDKTEKIIPDPNSSFMQMPKNGVWVKFEKL